MKNCNLKAGMICAVVLIIQPVGRCEDSHPDPWQMRDVWGIRFEGNETFESGDIRDALALDGEVQSTVDPNESLLMFQGTVLKRLIDGYRSKGFADVRAIAVETERERLKILITEGPRYRCGELRIIGDESPDRELLSSALSSKELKDSRNPLAGTTDSKKWTSGKYVQFSDEWLSEMRKRIADVLEGMGYYYPDFNVELVTDSEEHLAHLQINIPDAGSQQPVSDVRIHGLTRHSTEEILQHLNLPEKKYATAALEHLIRNKLENTGRFVYAKAWTDAPFGPEHAVPVHVQLREYEKVPPLSGQPSASQDALLRLGQWVRELPRSGNDLQVTIDVVLKPKSRDATTDSEGNSLPAAVRPHRLNADIFFAGTGGGLAHLKVFDPDQRMLSSVTLLLVKDRPGIVDWQNETKWVAAGAPLGAVSTFALEGHEPTDDGHEFRLNFGIGMTSDDVNPLRTVVLANPAAVVDLVEYEDEADVEQLDGIDRVTWSAGSMDIDRVDGRLIRLDLKSDAATVSAKGGPGILQAELDRVTAAAEKIPNSLNGDRTLASLIRYCATWAESVLAESNDQPPAGAGIILSLLKDESTTYELGKVVDKFLGDDNFTIPHQKSPESVPMFENWSLQALKGLVPTGSAPHRLASSVLHTKRSGDSTALATVLREIRRDSEHGALTCLMAGMLLKQYRGPLARIGLDRMEQRTDAGLPPEIAALIQLPCVAGNVLKSAIAFIRRLSEDEITLVTTFLQGSRVAADDFSTDMKEYDLRPFITLIRNHPSEDPAVILTEMLTSAWQLKARDLVRRQLVKWRDAHESAMKRVKPVSSSKSTDESGSVDESAAAREFNRRLDALSPPEETDSSYQPRLRF